MKYIGIRGERGSGKDLITYVISNVINYIIHNNEDPDKEQVDKWIKDIIDNENIIHEISLKYIYIDSFGDTIRTFVSLLLGCDIKYLYDDYYKDHMIINMATFEYKIYDDVPDNLVLISNEQLSDFLLKKGSPDQILSNIYISLRDFILYFGHDVMKRFFGANVWIKSLNSNNAMFENIFIDKTYKIYRDVKTTSEVTYIKDRKGIIIKINKQHNKKKKGLDTLSKDKRIDYIINIPTNIYDIYDDILKICKSILIENGKKKIEN